MTDSYQFNLALKALREVQAEMGMDIASGKTLFPGLDELLDSAPTLPDDALLCGIAVDGLPILLRLRDPRPGPVLVTGDRSSGKTAFLKNLVLSAVRVSPPGTLQFGVFTDYPDEWRSVFAPEYLQGVWPAFDQSVSDFLYQLAYETRFRNAQIPTVILFDGLDSILSLDDATRNNLTYLLEFGPRALIWPVVALNSERAVKLPDWLAFFRTRIYGRIANPATAEELTPVPGAELASLFPASQFSLRTKSRWLKFWLPSLGA